MITWLTREEWGADPNLPRLGTVLPHEQFTRLISHHTVIVMPDWDGDGFLHGDLDDVKRYMRSLQTARPDLGNDVPYSWVIFRGAGEYDAVVCEGRGWRRKGAHTAGYNHIAYGLAWAGDMTDLPPSIGMLIAFRELGSWLADPINAQSTLGHRDVDATQCPGNAAYPHLDKIQPPFERTPETLNYEELLMSGRSFQLVSGSLAVLYVPGLKAISLAGLGATHSGLHETGTAEAVANVSQYEIDEFSVRWNAARGA